MIYLLDTNICIYIMKNRPEQVKQKLMSIPMNSIGISSIVLAELWHGVYKSQYVQKNTAALKDFLKYLNVYDWTQECTELYGYIRANLERAGTVIGSNDLFIAAHAIQMSATLVTNNIKEFERVENLLLENWVYTQRD